MVASTRPSYLLRTLHPRTSAPLAAALQHYQQRHLESRGGVPLGCQTDLVLAQARLPLQDGGLAQLDPESLPGEAFTACLALAAPHLSRLGDEWVSTVEHSTWLNSAILHITEGPVGTRSRVCPGYARLLPPLVAPASTASTAESCALAWVSFYTAAPAAPAAAAAAAAQVPWPSPALASAAAQSPERPAESAAASAAALPAPAIPQEPAAAAEQAPPSPAVQAPPAPVGSAASDRDGHPANWIPPWTHAKRPVPPDNDLLARLHHGPTGALYSHLPELITLTLKNRPGSPETRTLIGVRNAGGLRSILLAPEQPDQPPTSMALTTVANAWRLQWKNDHELDLQEEFARDYLHKLPRRVVKVAGDGNCALRCLGAVLCKPYQTLRANLVAHLTDRPDVRGRCWAGAAAGLTATPEQYQQLLATDGTYLGDLELDVLGSMEGRMVRLFSARHSLPICVGRTDSHQEPIDLWHCGVDNVGRPNHFDLLTRTLLPPPRDDSLQGHSRPLPPPPEPLPAAARFASLQAKLAAARNAQSRLRVELAIRTERGTLGACRFAAAQGSLPCAFLSQYRRPVFPCPVLHLSHQAFQAAIRLRLGLSPIPLDSPGLPATCLCHTPLSSVAATHILSCASLREGRGDAVVKRHDLLRDVVAWACRQAGLAVQLEPNLSLTDKLRADLIVRDLHNNGYLVDVTVHDTTRPSSTSPDPLTILGQADLSKQNKYAAHALRLNLSPMPLVFDVGGFPTPRAGNFLTFQGVLVDESRLSRQDGGRGHFLSTYAWAVSVALQTHNYTLAHAALAMLRGVRPERRGANVSDGAPPGGSPDAGAGAPGGPGSDDTPAGGCPPSGGHGPPSSGAAAASTAGAAGSFLPAPALALSALDGPIPVVLPAVLMPTTLPPSLSPSPCDYSCGQFASCGCGCGCGCSPPLLLCGSSREGLGRETGATSAQVTVKAGLTCFTRKKILPSLACTGRHSGSRHRSRPRECSAEVGELSLSWK